MNKEGKTIFKRKEDLLKKTRNLHGCRGKCVFSGVENIFDIDIKMRYNYLKFRGGKSVVSLLLGTAAGIGVFWSLRKFTMCLTEPGKSSGLFLILNVIFILAGLGLCVLLDREHLVFAAIGLTVPSIIGSGIIFWRNMARGKRK